MTRKLADAAVMKFRYFRHPFLHVGGKIEQRRAFETFLAARGYTVAPVTVDNDDFVYAAAYANAVRRGDTATAARIGDDYLRYMDEVFTHFEAASRRVLGREIPHILARHLRRRAEQFLAHSLGNHRGACAGSHAETAGVDWSGGTVMCVADGG